MIRWKELMKILYLNGTLCLLLCILVGCAGDKNEDSTAKSTENNLTLESKEEVSSTGELGETKTDNADDTDSDEPDNNSAGSNDLNVDDKQDLETLADYSNEEIEYARIWLQLGVNQELEELNVRHISAGTPLNENDETSEDYPEDVIQLAGSRLVDGSVTYSSNRNGSINVYNVPLRWDGINPAGKKFYRGIIKDIKLVSVKPGDDEKIIELIKLIRVHK
ncbi:hypothetical protein ACQKL5_12405 [Peribacillus sp. NPDC097675]|uniref:hypothetical protein n=1 Tax=Peribacillus sp. NPDC097675 TaxID=3390618 RepID=UPI003CFD2C1E